MMTHYNETETGGGCRIHGSWCVLWGPLLLVAINTIQMSRRCLITG